MGDYLGPINLGTGVEIELCFDYSPTLSPSFSPSFSFSPSISFSPTFSPSQDAPTSHPSISFSPTASPTPCPVEQFSVNGSCVNCGCGDFGSCKNTDDGSCVCTNPVYFGPLCNNRQNLTTSFAFGFTSLGIVMFVSLPFLCWGGARSATSRIYKKRSSQWF